MDEYKAKNSVAKKEEAARKKSLVEEKRAHAKDLENAATLKDDLSTYALGAAAIGNDPGAAAVSYAQHGGAKAKKEEAQKLREEADKLEQEERQLLEEAEALLREV